MIGGAGLLNHFIDMGLADTIYRTVVLNSPLKGNVVRVLKPEDRDPVWKSYALTQEVDGDGLRFLTYEKIKRS
ncbi:hypothetical protein D3C81_1416630 [compost metagenome]